MKEFCVGMKGLAYIQLIQSIRPIQGPVQGPRYIFILMHHSLNIALTFQECLSFLKIFYDPCTIEILQNKGNNISKWFVQATHRNVPEIFPKHFRYIQIHSRNISCNQSEHFDVAAIL